MTSLNTDTAATETDSYSLLPEIELMGSNLFSQRSLVLEVNKAFMKICLKTAEESF